MLDRIPKNRQYGYIGIILAAAVFYIGWSIYSKPSQQPGQGFVPAKPAVNSDKVPGSTVKVPLKVVPKKAVKREFPEAHVDDPDDEVIDTADIPPAPNGATAITTMNVQTGEAHTEIKIKEPPWFALERTNYIGIGIEQHYNGEQKGKVYYKRDFVRVKDLHLQGEAVIKAGTSRQVEGYAGANLELRF